MPLPVKSLPVIQNWDCHGCGDCCRLYNVRVTDEEKARIEAQDWAAELAGVTPIVWDKSLNSHRLAARRHGHADRAPAAEGRRARLAVPEGDVREGDGRPAARIPGGRARGGDGRGATLPEGRPGTGVDRADSVPADRCRVLPRR